MSGVFVSLFCLGGAGVWCWVFFVWLVGVFFSITFILSNFLRAVNFPYFKLELWSFMVIDFFFFFLNVGFNAFWYKWSVEDIAYRKIPELFLKPDVYWETKQKLCDHSHWNLKLKLVWFTFLKWLRMHIITNNFSLIVPNFTSHTSNFCKNQILHQIKEPASWTNQKPHVVDDDRLVILNNHSMCVGWDLSAQCTVVAGYR